MSSILDDLANQSSGRENDPRYALGQDDIQVGLPLLASKDRMRAIFEDVVSQRFPTKEEREQYRTRGQHVDPVTKEKRQGHRYRVQTGSLPIEGFVGQMPESQFGGWTVPLLLDGTQSSFWHGLAKEEQPNGDWVPTEVKTKPGRERTKNGRRPVDMARALNGVSSSEHGDTNILEWIGENPQEVFEVGVEMMDYWIVWTDRKNAPDLPARGPDGKPIQQERDVNVTVAAPAQDQAPMIAAVEALTKVATALADRKPAAEEGPVKKGPNGSTIIG